MCIINVGLLAFFGAATQQDYDPLPILAKINSITGTEIQPQFEDTRAYPLCSRKIASFEPVERDGNPCLYIAV